MKNKIINFLNEKYKGTTRFIKPKMFMENFGKDAYASIESAIPWIKEPFSLKVFCYINDIIEEPKCKICQKSVPFKCSELKFQTYCSKKCMFADNETIQSVKRNTCMKKYGAINVLASDYGKKKLKETLLEKYGTDNYTKTEEYKNRIKSGKIEKKYCGDLIGESLRKKHFVTLPDKFPDLIPMFEFEEYKGSGNYITQYDWKCKKCDHIFKRWLNCNYKLECPKCKGNLSDIEKFIQDYLHSKSIAYIKRTKKIIEKRELDMYIPELNIAIECNGLYWHSDLMKSKDYHLDKTEQCESKGIRLIQIFADEIHYKSKAVINRLNNIFKLNRIKISSDDCEVREVDHVTTEKFLLKYNLEGIDNPSHIYGLYYKNRLLSIMTFEKCKTEGLYKYSRFCTINGVEVLNGDKKMLDFFIQRVNPLKIITKACRRWNTGEHYEKLGFKLLEKSEPLHWYTDKSYLYRFHRFSFAKQLLSKKLENFDASLSEKENMEKNGFRRIYDCGVLKYELTP